MNVYLRAKFQASSVSLTSFKQGVISPPTSKRIPKKPTQIRVKSDNAVKSNSTKYIVKEKMPDYN